MTPTTDPRAVAASYDDLAADYRRLFADWLASSRRQGAALQRVVTAALGPGPHRVLDCAAGVGTQALALAELGHHVVATDLSARALREARADERGPLLAGLAVADMRRLPLAGASVDVVVCADNSLPHLLTPADAGAALREMRRVLRPGGLVLVSTRDYDELRRTRPQATPVQLSRRDGVLSATFQVWTWHEDGEHYDYEHLMVTGGPQRWRVGHRTGTYWAVPRSELEALATDAGLAAVRWLLPEQSGFFQPLLVARA